MIVKEKEGVREVVAIAPKEARGSALAVLLSRVEHPVEISYDGKGLMVYPRGKTAPLEKNKLGAVPKGVQIIDVAGRG
jgi:hypothetical protein